jgi:hypothetical protein
MSIGDRVTCDADVSDDDSGDAGRIVSFATENIAVVAWDSCVETEIEIARLTHE